MFKAPRRWFKRNRNNLAVGAGILGAAYLAGQYVLGKIKETRQRMSDERVARENLRRRFRQNQEDCTYTVLALLPTATENALKAIPVEDVIQELQSRKTDKRMRASTGPESTPSEAPSTIDDDARSFASSNYVHASQITTEAGDVSGVRSSESNIYAKKTKLQLWSLLKISSITRAVTLIYVLSLLTLFTRIQLNLLGRRTYLSSVISLATPPQDGSRISLENRDDDNIDQDYGDDFDTNRKYLTFSWWLLQRGWIVLLQKVETAVKDTFGPLTPREDVTFDQLSALVLVVRKKVEGVSEEERRLQRWLEYLLPPRNEEENVLRESGTNLSPPTTPVGDEGAFAITPSLRRLLDETSDLVDSPTFTSILTLLLDSAFSLLIDGKVGSLAYRMDLASMKIVQDAPEVAKEAGNPRVIVEEHDGVDETADVGQCKAKLATILAVFARQAHVIGSGGNLNILMGTGAMETPETTAQSLSDANEYLAAMEMVGDLESFAAVMYSSNFEIEAAASKDSQQKTKENLGTIWVEEERSPVAEEASIQNLLTDQALDNIWDSVVAK